MNKRGAAILVVNDEREIVRALQRSLTAHAGEPAQMPRVSTRPSQIHCGQVRRPNRGDARSAEVEPRSPSVRGSASPFGSTPPILPVSEGVWSLIGGAHC